MPGGSRGGIERHDAVPGSLIQWAQPARGTGQKEGYIMPTVDREEMLNLARRIEVGLVVNRHAKRIFFIRTMFETKLFHPKKCVNCDKSEYATKQRKV